MSNDDLNAIYFAIGSLREARALLLDQCRGTNDRKYDLCKEYEITIERAEKAYKNISKKHHESP